MTILRSDFNQSRLTDAKVKHISTNFRMSTLLLRTLRGVTSCNPTGGCDRFVLSFKTSGWDRGVISRSISSLLGSRQNPAQATILFRVTSRRIEVLSRRPNVRFKFDFSGKKTGKSQTTFLRGSKTKDFHREEQNHILLHAWTGYSYNGTLICSCAAL